MNLKKFLNKNNLTQREFSEILNIHYMHLNMILKKKRRPSPELALKIEKATSGEVTVMELLYPESEVAA